MTLFGYAACLTDFQIPTSPCELGISLDMVKEHIALQARLHDILSHENAIVVDICGECSTILDLAEEQIEAAQNDSVNEQLSRLLSTDGLSTP